MKPSIVCRQYVRNNTNTQNIFRAQQNHDNYIDMTQQKQVMTKRLKKIIVEQVLKSNKLADELQSSSGQLEEALSRESALKEDLCNISLRAEKLENKFVIFLFVLFYEHGNMMSVSLSNANYVFIIQGAKYATGIR